MTTVPLFVELCAGTAALSLRLHKDGARPPVSRMGAKTGYADAILRVLGLHPGQRAERYLWCEPDPGVRLLLHAYRDATLAKAAATIIRGWKDEGPRALWVRLREEGPPRLPDGEVDPREVARWARIVTVNRLIPVHHDGVKWCNSARNTAGVPTKGGLSFGGDDFCTPIAALADGFDVSPVLPALIHPDARDIDPPTLPPGTVAYLDGPYENTTPYAHLLPRAEQVVIARRWAEAGATVAISEAEPIPELMAEGWYSVEITNQRVGQKRTFSKQQAEWLTINRRPVWVPPVQGSLFG